MLFRVAGVYGLALSLLIFSSIVSPIAIDLFVAQPYTLGTHGADWEYWHAVGCAFVGIICMAAHGWPDHARRVGRTTLTVADSTRNIAVEDQPGSSTRGGNSRPTSSSTAANGSMRARSPSPQTPSSTHACASSRRASSVRTTGSTSQ